MACRQVLLPCRIADGCFELSVFWVGSAEAPASRDAGWQLVPPLASPANPAWLQGSGFTGHGYLEVSRESTCLQLNMFVPCLFLPLFVSALVSVVKIHSFGAFWPSLPGSFQKRCSLADHRLTLPNYLQREYKSVSLDA